MAVAGIAAGWYWKVYLPAHSTPAALGKTGATAGGGAYHGQAPGALSPGAPALVVGMSGAATVAAANAGEQFRTPVAAGLPGFHCEHSLISQSQ